MIFWIDRTRRKYFRKEIDDKYLINIANALTRGIGDSTFVNQRVIEDIFEECFNRGLLTSEQATDMIEDAVNAFSEREESDYNRLRGEIEYEEHAFGTD